MLAGGFLCAGRRATKAGISIAGGAAFSCTVLSKSSICSRQWLSQHSEVAQFVLLNKPGPSTALGVVWNFCAKGEQKRLAHKFAAPECPNLLKLRAAVEQNLQPICFYVKNDYAMGHHVYDQHFYGILCSPLFEGKTYAQINAMVDRLLEPIGLKGRVKLHCQPPSRFEKLRGRLRWRWQLEK